MPDGSTPDYYQILKHMQNFQTPLIGKSYFYIRKFSGSLNLCRIIPGGGQIFYHEFVDLDRYRITEADLEESTRNSAGTDDGYFPVSAEIETKLRRYITGD